MAKLVIRTDGLPAEVIVLKKGVSRFGRSSGNDFQIHHDSISRNHCLIELLDDGMFVRDLDSSNGTFVNNQQVERARLDTGQILRLGDVSLEVKDAPEPVDPAQILMCCVHPKYPASMRCTQCKKVFCGPCIHILKRTDGQMLRLCPECSGHCDPIKLVAEVRKKTLGTFIKNLFKKDAGETQPVKK